MTQEPMTQEHRVLRRRTVLRGLAGLGTLGAVGVAAGCERQTPQPASLRERILAAEAARATTGKRQDVRLRAMAGQVDIGRAKPVTTWSYGGQLPGQLIRADVGSVLSVSLDNALPDPTTIHWHGLALRNDMDGVPDVTQKAIAAGSSFRYEFTLPDPGTYFFHPHVGVQLDRGLYAPLIIEDPNAKVDYDDEWVLVLDDWTDGLGEAPDAILTRLRQGMGGMNMGGGSGGMGGMDMGSGSSSASPLGNDTGDVEYPTYLVNGRVPEAPELLKAKPGAKIRLRIINAAGDTPFRVALAGHSMSITHTDGFAVEPQTVDALLIGMGERYDVVVTLKDGVFPLVAAPEGKKGAPARAVVRTGAGSMPAPTSRPRELTGRLGEVSSLRATADAALASRSPSRSTTMRLTGDMQKYVWSIDGRPYSRVQPISVKQGERLRLVMRNETMMFHPMHLHGHTFQLVTDDGRPGARKDTVIVKPMMQVAVDIEADNPGRWLTHCHNIYHAEAGMMTRLDYA